MSVFNADKLVSHLTNLNLVFRKVKVVKTNPEHIVSIAQKTPKVTSDSSLPLIESTKKVASAFTPEEYLKNVEVRYTHGGFFGFTEHRSIRAENDKYQDTGIFFSSFAYQDFDALTFSWVPKDKSELRGIPPKKDDLICMQVGYNREHRRPCAVKWFICSHQFLHMWTMIMYGPGHHSFESKYKDESETSRENLKRWLFCGNRLCTNSYLKWAKTCLDNNQALNAEEAKEKYWHLRVERFARTHVHVYAAIVLMICYGELPTKNNVPQNRDGSFAILHWDIPENFVSRFITYWHAGFFQNDSSLTPEMVDEMASEMSGNPVPEPVKLSLKHRSDSFDDTKATLAVSQKIVMNDSEFPELPSVKQVKMVDVKEEEVFSVDFEKCLGSYEEIKKMNIKRYGSPYWADWND